MWLEYLLNQAAQQAPQPAADVPYRSPFQWLYDRLPFGPREWQATYEELGLPPPGVDPFRYYDRIERPAEVPYEPYDRWQGRIIG